MLSPGPLTGLRVLDCTHMLAGPWCGLILADLGADVIKVEPPEGESTRDHGQGDFRVFDYINRNKRGVAIDLSQPEGPELLRCLAAKSDVFIENWRPGVLDAKGLGFSDLSALNPRLIYGSISGFGHSGPFRNQGLVDLVAQAVSGLMSFAGAEDAARPSSLAIPISDLNSGTFAAIGILAALVQRGVSGKGQWVEATLQETALSYCLYQAGRYLSTGHISKPQGTRHTLAAPYEVYRTADGYIALGAGTQSLWRRACDVLGQPDLAADPRFADMEARLSHRDALQDALEDLLVQDVATNWAARFAEKGVPAAKINNIAEALDHPQIAARHAVVDIAGQRFMRTPIQLSDATVTVTRGAPAVGEHTREVLAESGLSADDVDALISCGAVFDTRRLSHV